MKKSEMKTLNYKTAEVQRILRSRHKECVFAGSDLIIRFEKIDKRRKENDLVAKCSNCLIDRTYDIGDWIL